MKVNSMVTVMAMMQNRQYLADGVGAALMMTLMTRNIRFSVTLHNVRGQVC